MRINMEKTHCKFLNQNMELEVEKVALPRIWIKGLYIYGQKERTNTLREGMKVSIERGRLVDCMTSPTHIITECRGTKGWTSLEISVMNLNDSQLSTVKL